MSKTLMIWNGMAAKQVGGGDLYTAKLINYSGGKKDIILPKNSIRLIGKGNKLYVTDDWEEKGLLSLILIYLIRVINTIRIIIKNNKRYNLSISSSPFLFDLIPQIFVKANKKIVILFHIIPDRKAVNFSTKVRFFIAGLEKKIGYFLIRRYFDAIITGNVIVKKDLSKLFPEKKILIAHAGINTKKLGKINNQKDKNLACFIGRLTSQKGILDMVEIVKGIIQQNPLFKLIIIGDGPDKKELITRIKKEKIEKNMILMGFVSDEEKRDILRRSKFFFFPSYEEGWGIALAEGLYHQCTCICYELPHYRDIFRDYPIYVKIGDKKGFLKKLVENQKKEVKKGQHKFISEYDDKLVIQDLIQHL